MLLSFINALDQDDAHICDENIHLLTLQSYGALVEASKATLDVDLRNISTF